MREYVLRRLRTQSLRSPAHPILSHLFQLFPRPLTEGDLQVQPQIPAGALQQPVQLLRQSIPERQERGAGELQVQSQNQEPYNIRYSHSVGEFLNGKREELMIFKHKGFNFTDQMYDILLSILAMREAAVRFWDWLDQTEPPSDCNVPPFTPPRHNDALSYQYGPSEPYSSLGKTIMQSQARKLLWLRPIQAMKSSTIPGDWNWSRWWSGSKES